MLGSATAAAFGVAASGLLGGEPVLAADTEIAVMTTTAGEMVRLLITMLWMSDMGCWARLLCTDLFYEAERAT